MKTNLMRGLLAVGLIHLGWVQPCLFGADLASASQPAGGEDWPQWRGPRRDAIPVVQDLPQDFAKGFKRLWEAKGLCTGKNPAAWSAPVIMGDKLVVTGRDGTKDLVVCLHVETGQELWKKDYEAPTEKDVQYGNGPRATPTIDGDRVFTYGCMGQVACWELADGKRVWMKKTEDFGGVRPVWGQSSSPLVYDGKVIIQTGGKSVAVALDKKTGEQVWASIPGPAGYAAPMVATVAGKPQLIIFGGEALLGLNPKSGEKLWQTPWPTAMAMNCTTPVMVGDKLLISSTNYGGKSGGTALFELSPTGAKAVWTTVKYGLPHNDPVVIDGHFYGYFGFSMDDKGSVVCADLATGESTWTSTELGGPGTMTRVGNQIVCLNNRGKMILIKPSTEGVKKVTEFQAIEGHPVWTLPVFARGKLFVRFEDRLVCYVVESNR